MFTLVSGAPPEPFKEGEQMRSIGVLNGMRKKKPCHDGRFRPVGGRFAFGRVLLLALLCCAISGFAAAGPCSAQSGGKDETLSTRRGENVITRDPATGDRVMQTPDPKPQDEYQGPQTIIVAPEVYPGGPQRPGGSRPPRPQPRQ